MPSRLQSSLKSSMGRALSHSIGALRWAAQRGARRCYLQVVDENASAMTLYGGLGFEVHHDYEHHVRDEAAAAPK